MATYRSVAVNFPFLKNSKLDASMWDTEKGCYGILTAYWLSVRVRGFIQSWMQVCGIQKKVAMVYLQLIGLVLGLGVYEVREFHLGFLSSLCYYRFIQSIQFKWFVKRVWGDFVFADSCATLRKFSTWTMDTALNFT